MIRLRNGASAGVSSNPTSRVHAIDSIMLRSLPVRDRRLSLIEDHNEHTRSAEREIAETS
jgi:hypothetical protein